MTANNAVHEVGADSASVQRIRVGDAVRVVTPASQRFTSPYDGSVGRVIAIHDVSVRLRNYDVTLMARDGECFNQPHYCFARWELTPA